MANTLKASETNIIVGLGTYTHTVASTGMYEASATATVNPSSSLSITISQSGSASASITSIAPASSQGSIDVRKVFNCVAGDVITVAISSAAAIDNQLNTVKMLVNVHQGSV